jgi:glutamate synthase domain-containing protein 1
MEKFDTMCGIIGVMLNKKGNVGELLYRMMLTLQHRGTDSAGIAVYAGDGLSEDEYILMIQVRDIPGAIGKIGDAVGKAGGDIRDIHVRISRKGAFGINKYIIRSPDVATLKQIVESVDSTDAGKVLSYGRSIEILKETGTVDDLEKSYGISKLNGTHGLGHVRFSTESRVDHSHAHPFHTKAHPDIAVVHNGQITNYNNIRRKLERRGYSFTTDNDTECIVHFVVDKLKQGHSLENALRASVNELDGPFSYIISTPDSIGVARDKLGLRPVMLAEDGSGHYIASEECALIWVCGDQSPVYLEPGEVRVYERREGR